LVVQHPGPVPVGGIEPFERGLQRAARCNGLLNPLLAGPLDAAEAARQDVKSDLTIAAPARRDLPKIVVADPQCSPVRVAVTGLRSRPSSHRIPAKALPGSAL
jgi:hypothetical protein